MAEPAKRLFKYEGKEAKNFGRHELIKPGQTITVNEGREADDLANNEDFTEVTVAEKAPAKPAK